MTFRVAQLYQVTSEISSFHLAQIPDGFTSDTFEFWHRDLTLQPAFDTVKILLLK